MPRFAIVAGGAVVNIIEYGAPPPAPPPGFAAGHIAIQSDSAGPGWLWTGGEFVNPNPPTPILPPAIPASVYMWQAKAALAALGKLDAANAAVAAGGNVALAIAWEYAAQISRNSPSVAAMGAVIGLDGDDIDQLFIAAADIAV